MVNLLIQHNLSELRFHETKEICDALMLVVRYGFNIAICYHRNVHATFARSDDLNLK